MSWIALATYRRAGGLAPALVLDDQLYDLEAARAAGLPPLPEAWVTQGVEAMLGDWANAQAWLRDATPIAAALATSGAIRPVADGAAAVAAPFVPSRIFCAASNYASHANEMGTVLAAKSQSKPYMFLKLSNTVIGNGETIQMPPETSKLDWEVELAAVIGKRCRRVSVEDALDAVACYTIVNDISARDLNIRGDYPFKHDWFQGKCHDTFAPIGPWLVPAWQIPDPQAVQMRLDVNDEPMQQDSTANMIWTVREQIAYLSTIVTLEPGDVIATGTPTGVGMGRGIYLKPGDRLVASIEGIGRLANQVQAERV
ncbi:2-keto-4-pentenoate hydratase/2-oxohepta-3-ene-1,7-dioic acid hydratase in catechol pathway [Variovorax boronicumulans]|uniref:2-keto-4-pentenoate hydratase/2-oxohepta-3-ene-1,7-dioic acid hydratase in catechol pathway n=1 Tax=Variovorax boronicumulans TaxID=436515 RepID=A0AAW8DTQ6_9BURK|nr:fumarylacetoacetate hydrolase family protein [Variovorax boronicumulans]MDP9877490.1 2-keto-4-pentenoate hydratase/2-oxohepta-3-ene-1,7-dioic acid hydratase in catechol pathway [Variovorax boronicumulans]MDP9922775.1 2-keto-4-pentenoate hydratase/2-oxohepta-3-ene-1,7-dioic acid hydratase in catechol pathway [Variovorax boronicumulans]